MRTTTRMFAFVATLGLAACGGEEPEAVEPETTESAGGALTTQPQAGSEMEARSDVELAEPEWGEPERGELGEPQARTPQYGQPSGMAGEPYGQQQGMQPGMQPSANPEELRTQIEEALRGAPNLDDDSISVRIEQGSVYLAGLVDSPAEIQIAHNVAHSIPGVENVYTDELRIQ